MINTYNGWNMSKDIYIFMAKILSLLQNILLNLQ